MADMNTKDFLIGTLIGGIVGASAALLLAPKSGKELRSDISEQAQIAKEKTTAFTSNAYEKGNEWAQIAKDKSSGIAKTVQAQSQQVIGKVKEVASKVKNNTAMEAGSTDDYDADVASELNLDNEQKVTATE